MSIGLALSKYLADSFASGLIADPAVGILTATVEIHSSGIWATERTMFLSAEEDPVVREDRVREMLSELSPTTRLPGDWPDTRPGDAPVAILSPAHLSILERA